MDCEKDTCSEAETQTGRYKRLCLILSGTVPDGDSDFSLLCTHSQIKANMLCIGFGVTNKV